MAIEYSEIKKKIRFKNSDNDELQYSDYEIKEAVNEVIRYLSMSQAVNNSDYLDRGLTFDEYFYNVNGGHANFRDYGVELPEDFMTLTDIQRCRDGYPMHPCKTIDTPKQGEYKIMGNRLYSGEPSFKIAYKCYIPEIKDVDDVIELPRFFLDTIVKLSGMVLTGTEGDAMQQAVEMAVDAIIPKRKYVNARLPMQFKIGGYSRYKRR